MKKSLVALAFLGALTASEKTKAAHIDNLDLDISRQAQRYEANVSWDFKRNNPEERMDLLNYKVALHSGERTLDEQDVFLLCFSEDNRNRKYGFDLSNLENKFPDLEENQKVYASIQNLQKGNSMFTQFDSANSYEVRLPKHAPEPTTFLTLGLGAIPVLRKRR